MAAKPDFTYIDGGLFVTFLPETPAGEKAWREIAAKNDGVANIYFAHAKRFIASLRKAGFIVRKAKKSNDIDADKLLFELFS